MSASKKKRPRAGKQLAKHPDRVIGSTKNLENDAPSGRSFDYAAVKEKQRGGLPTNSLVDTARANTGMRRWGAQDQFVRVKSAYENSVEGWKRLKHYAKRRQVDKPSRRKKTSRDGTVLQRLGAAPFSEPFVQTSSESG